jgi:predicted Zn-dependent protease
MVPAWELAEQALAGGGSGSGSGGSASGSGSGSGDRIVLVRESVEAEVRYANNTVTTNGTRRDRHVTVISFHRRAAGDRRAAGVAAGVASGSGALEVSALVEAADGDARRAQLADDAFELVPGDGNVDAAFTDEPGSTSLSVLGDVISGLGDVFGRAEDSGRVMAGFARHQVVTTYLASTTGLRRRFVQPEGTVELVGRSRDGSRSSWAGAGTSGFDDVSLPALEERVVRGLAWAERRIELPAGRYETILPGDAVADLVIMIDSGLSGREAEEGRSVFSAPGGRTRVGERLMPLPFVLRSDPFAPGLESAPFVEAGTSSADHSVFDNGLGVGRTDWISEGALQRLRYHRAGAARSAAAGLPAEFGPEAGNLVLELPGASASLEDLVARTERGLLVTCLWYIREVDPATMLYTGLTRDGVYLVEGGEVVGVVNNFRFNESPIDMLARTTEAGRTERCLSREWGSWVTRTAMPPLRVGEFNMSSVSPAT